MLQCSESELGDEAADYSEGGVGGETRAAEDSLRGEYRESTPRLIDPPLCSRLGLGPWPQVGLDVKTVQTTETVLRILVGCTVV